MSTDQYLDTDNHKLQIHVTKSPVIHPQRKSTKSKHRCPSRDPPKGDTFHRTRTKGRGCKRHPAPPQMPPRSRSDVTAPSMRTGALNDSKDHTLIPNKTRAGKKRGHSPQQETNSASLIPSTTSLLTQRPKPKLHSTAKTRNHHKKVKKKSHCCGSSMPVRGDTFQPHCKSCLEEATASHMATTSTHGIPIPKTTETSFTPNVRITASPPKDGKQQKEVQSSALHSTTGECTHLQ